MTPFEPTGLGRTIFEDRYRMGEETWLQACERVATCVAAAESNGNRDRFVERFKSELEHNYFMPGGRIWYGAGRPKPSLLNCYVLDSPADSREGWGKTTSEVIVVSGMMGGIGINMSSVRPRGSAIRGTGGVATGAVSLMQLINGVGDVIVGGGSRRMALMLCLDITHPDIEEFLHVKLDLKQLNNANISIVLPEGFSAAEFRRRIENDEDIELSFSGLPAGKSIKARWLWDKLVQNAWQNGEPGLLNMDLVNAMSNVRYDTQIVSTNPCGEQALPPYGSCVLGALVLPRFVDRGDFDWDKFDESIRLGVRFLDDVIDVNHYPLPEIERRSKQERRIGLGIMGLHSALLEMGLNYDSEASLKFVDELGAFWKHTTYDASINLAIEKGQFPLFKKDMLSSGFMKSMKRGIRNKIKEHGIRNACLMTVAPTGTTAMVCGTSSGIEPLPPAVYWRVFYKPDADGQRVLDRQLVVEKSFEQYPGVQSAIDVPVESHFAIQATLQRHVDGAISKTINLPVDYPVEKLSKIWLQYIDQCKGVTVYRYGSRKNEPIQPIPREQWASVMAKHRTGAETASAEELMALECPSGVCDLK